MPRRKRLSPAQDVTVPAQLGQTAGIWRTLSGPSARLRGCKNPVTLRPITESQGSVRANRTFFARDAAIRRRDRAARGRLRVLIVVLLSIGACPEGVRAS